MIYVVVDDEVKIREGLRRYLQARKDCEQVYSFPHTAAALERLPELQADVLLTDIRMPGLSGLELIETITKAYPELTTIIISGYSEFDYARKAIELGVRRYLTKPTDIRELNVLLDEIAAERGEREQPEDRVVRDVMSHVERHFTEKITLEQLAGAAFVSPNYLCRRFKEMTGISPMEYLARYRIEQACLLLHDGQMTIGEIARRTGFADRRAFSRVFKRWQGVTPQDYRNSL